MAAAEDITVQTEEEPEASALAVAETDPVEVDEVVGRYRLRFEVASGGMATLYLATAEGSGASRRVVAIKRIHPHLEKEREFVEMFVDEARIASQLTHPNLCGVIDHGVAAGRHWMAMDYVMGEPLGAVASALSRQLQSEREVHEGTLIAARAIADACEGLHAAHEACDVEGRPLNVVHRDVSPHNLLVGFDGVVRVIDFGIASADRRVHQTETGLVKGKFAYMSPEQMVGEPVDRRADVWSLGVVLWELLAGRKLFRRPTQTETIFAVTRDPVPSLAGERAGVDLELDAIVRKALARDVSMRWPTARAMGRALAKWLAQHGDAYGSAELAERMAALFPTGLSRRRMLIARTLGAPRLAEQSSGEKSAGAIEVSRKPARSAEARAEEDAVTASLVTIPPKSGVVRRSWSSVTAGEQKEAWLTARGWMMARMAIGVALAVGVGVGVGLAVGQGETRWSWSVEESEEIGETGAGVGVGSGAGVGSGTGTGTGTGSGSGTGSGVGSGSGSGSGVGSGPGSGSGSGSGTGTGTGTGAAGGGVAVAVAALPEAAGPGSIIGLGLPPRAETAEQAPVAASDTSTTSSRGTGAATVTTTTSARGGATSVRVAPRRAAAAVTGGTAGLATEWDDGSETTAPVGPPGFVDVAAADGQGAELSVDGRSAGQAPARIELAPGRHHLTLERDGVRVRRRVTVRSGETTTMRIELTP